tara:strand:+ start:93 stop:764 length:672 start_codon:yes stop_codon:yes gene_type:complete
MHQRISKKIIIYLFLLSLLTTINNKSLSNFDLFNIKDLNILGINEEEKLFIEKKLSYIKNENILFLEKLNIQDQVETVKSVEKYSIFKIYPSKLEIDIKRAQFFAITKINEKNFYIGSNGKYIEIDDVSLKLPYIFGYIDINEFLKIKKKIDKSEFNYKKIKNFFFYKSSRFDIETYDGLTIRLPKSDLENKLDLLISLLNNEIFKEKKIIDLRQKNQVIVNE